MELVDSDMKKLLSSKPQVELTEEHVVTILYNSLCALNFMHSANVIHRDIKPGNFLIDGNCGVKICDFGLSRTLPKKSKELKNFKELRKTSRKQVNYGEQEKKRLS